MAGGLSTDTLTTTGGVGIGGAPPALTNGINGNSGWYLAVANTALLTFTAGNVAIAGSASLTGPLTSTVATTGSTPPFVVASSDNVPNLNASSLNGATFASPGPIASTTPGPITATSMADTGLTNGACVQVGTLSLLTTPLPQPCNTPAFQSVTTKQLAANVDAPTNTLITVDSQTVTMPATGCPCRVLITYSYWWKIVSGSAPDQMNIYVTDGVSNYAPSQQTTGSTSQNPGQSATQVSASYANSANVTFTVKAEGSPHLQIDKAGVVISTLNSYLQLTVQTSVN